MNENKYLHNTRASISLSWTNPGNPQQLGIYEPLDHILCLLLTGKGIFSYEYIDDLKLQDTRLPLPENFKVFSEVRPSQ